MLKYNVAQQNNRPHNLSIATLRIIAILAVIFIHSSTQTLDASHFAIQKIPWTLFFNQTARFAVPLFFFISGFVLELSYRENFTYSRYIKRRASRILTPYIFWSFIYSIVITKKQFGLDFIATLLLGNAEYHLYFIPTLIIFYCIFPLLHQKYQYLASKKVMIPLIITESVLLFYDYYINTFDIYDIFRVAILNFGIFILGMIASHRQERILTWCNKWKYLLSIALPVLLVAVYYESKIYYVTQNTLTAIYSQYRPLMYIYTLVLAAFLFWLLNRIRLNQKLIILLSRLSFFVFFIHVWILNNYFDHFGKQLFKAHNTITQQIWYDPTVFIMVSCISFTIAYLIHKVPHINKITG